MPMLSTVCSAFKHSLGIGMCAHQEMCLQQGSLFLRGGVCPKGAVRVFRLCSRMKVLAIRVERIPELVLLSQGQILQHDSLRDAQSMHAVCSAVWNRERQSYQGKGCATWGPPSNCSRTGRHTQHTHQARRPYSHSSRWHTVCLCVVHVLGSQHPTAPSSQISKAPHVLMARQNLSITLC